MQKTINTDTLCQEILVRHADGHLDGTEARKQLAEALHLSGIAATVAREKMLPSPQTLRDLTAEMEELIYNKLMQTEPGGFDLDLALDSSTTGWARQLLRTARASLLRNITTRTIAKMELVDPINKYSWEDAGSVGTTMAVAHTRFHTASVADTEDPISTGQTMQDAADWLRSKTRHLRDSSKLAAQAATIMHGYSVPALIRPRMPERKRLKALIDEDQSLAHRSAEAMRALIDSEAPSDLPDHGLLALWDDYSYDHIEAISQADPKVALTLVDAALSDRARPSRTVLRSFRASVRAMGTGRGWARKAEEACEAFIALEFEAYSSFDTTGVEFQAERIAGRKIACLRAPDVFKRTLAHPGQRLGLTVDEMYDQLDRLIRSLTDLEVKAPA